MMRIRLLVAVLTALFAQGAGATVYFRYNAESAVVGSALPNPPFCWTECGAGTESGQTVGRVGNTGGTPDGTKYFYWNIVAYQHDHYNEVSQSPGLPTANLMGQTIYLAYFFRLERQGSVPRYDIYLTGTSVQSGEKGVEVRGDGIRWVTSLGQWDSYASNQPSKFTIWAGNPSFHLNPSLEVSDAYLQNQNGYSQSNPQQLSYETWNSVVMGIKLSNTNTGSITIWANGVKNTEYLNIPTVSGSSAIIRLVEMGGTLCQPAYDCPAHVRKYDALLLTDTWQDVIDGGYMSLSPIVVPDVTAVTCSPSTIQAPTTTTCTATLSGGTPDSYAWAVQSCGTPARCTTTSTNNPGIISCAYGGACTICLTVTNTAGSDNMCATPVTVKYVKPSGLGAQ